VEARRDTVAIDLGRCLFCGACAEACPQGTIQLTREYRMAGARRDDLWVRSEDAERVASALNQTAQRIFGRSLRLRQVSAGGCAACEADLNVLGTIAWDIGRFGIEFVASPRHADGLVVTGSVTENMALALEKTWDATPESKIVIAVGACAIFGGPFAGDAEVGNGPSDPCPSTCSSQAARRTLSQSWTECSTCSGESASPGSAVSTDRCHWPPVP